MNTNEFIIKANKIHNNEYDYTKSVYTTQRNKLTIICKIHGSFEQAARGHLSGQGCPKCALLSPKRYKKDKNHFIKSSIKYHGNKYDYSKVVYKSSNKKVIIICPKHGEFEQRANAHMSGQGCPLCDNHNRHNTKEFITAAKEKHGDKYDYSKVNYKDARTKIIIICKKHGEFEQRPYQHINGQGCAKCGYISMQNNLSFSTNEFIQKAICTHKNRYIYDEVQYFNRTTPIIIKCKKHGKFTQRPNDHLNGCGCPQCAGTNLQNEVYEFVKSINNNVEYENKTIINPLEIDIYLPHNHVGIEVNGNYWHSYDNISIENKNKHYNKYELCKKENIQLIQIREDEWINKRSIVESIIKSKLNVTNKIYARKCKIKEINNKEYREFITNNHIQGHKTASIKLGLYYSDELVSCMSFNRHPKYEWEINRFCNKLGYTVIGGASKLFKHFIKQYNPNNIITYADRRYSNGNLYRKLRFKLDGVTNPNYCYVKKNKTYSRQQFMKHKLKDKLEVFDPNKTEAENMFMNGYRRLWDAGNYRFIY